MKASVKRFLLGAVFPLAFLTTVAVPAAAQPLASARFYVEAVQMRVIDETGPDWPGSDEIIALFNNGEYEMATVKYENMDTGDTRLFLSGNRCIWPAVDPDREWNESWFCAEAGGAGPVTFTVSLYEHDGSWRNIFLESGFCAEGRSDDVVPLPRGCTINPNATNLVGRYRMTISQADLVNSMPNVGDTYTNAFRVDNCSETVTVDDGSCASWSALPTYAAYDVTYLITRVADAPPARPILAIEVSPEAGRVPSPLASAQEDDGASSIVGGTVEPDYRHPWVVLVGGCKGVLLDPQWVLTAAHCVTTGLAPGSVTYSRTDPRTGAVQSENLLIARVHIHPMYDPRNDHANDIALIRLVQRFTITPFLQTVALPRGPRQPGVVGTVASFSHTGGLLPGQFAIFRAPLPPLDGGHKIHIPATTAGATLCKHDSGSGFVTLENGRATVRGIASEATATDCTTISGESDFMDVHMFHDWILYTMGTSDASLAGNTRVRRSGRGARGVMGIGCVNPHGTLWGSLEVAGTEVRAQCEPNQTQTVICNLEAVQGRSGPTAPAIAGFTMRTTTSSGVSGVEALPISGNHASYFGMLPSGVSREFTCEIGTTLTGPLTGENAPPVLRNN